MNVLSKELEYNGFLVGIEILHNSINVLMGEETIKFYTNLTWSDGLKTGSVAEIEQEAESFFKNLLSSQTNSMYPGIDALRTFIQNGISDDHYGALEAPVTEKEIEEAMFSLHCWIISDFVILTIILWKFSRIT